jgi:hypothetical protein
MHKGEITVVDEEYGEMTFQDLEGNMSLSNRISLAISKKRVEVVFSVKPQFDRPSKMQREFLKNVVLEFDRILDSIYRTLPKDLSSLTRQKFATDFQLWTIGVPLVEEGQKDWDMSFVSLENGRMSLLVSMRNWEAISSFVDIDSRNWFTRAALKILVGK